MKKYLIILLVVLAAAAVWFLVGNKTEVALAVVKRDVALDAVPAAVKVDPEFQVTLSSDVAGLVRHANVKTGQLVNEGDLLFEIDSADYQLELEKLERLLATTKAQFALDLNQRTALARQQADLKIFEDRTRAGEYPELELKHRREDLAMAIETQSRERLDREQQVADISHDIKLKKKAIAECSIKSPTTGTVTAVFAQPGESILMRAALVRLYSKALLVEARINEEDFSGIRVGLDASVRFLAYGPEMYAAKVIKVLPNADPLNQQYRAYLEVVIPEDRLIPGLSGEASIVRNRRTSTLVAPRAALFNGAVFVIKAGVVERRVVEIGFKSLTAIEILKGVSEGETLAVTHLDSLDNGQRVRVGK
jgi:multidrug resistance efflux pump